MELIDNIDKLELHYYNQEWNIFITMSNDAFARARADRIWSRRGGVYYTIKDGLVSFMVNPNSGGGLGAEMLMDDGQKVRISGCWSSNPQYIHEVLGIMSHEVAINNVAANLTHEAFLKLAERFNLVVTEPGEGRFYWNVAPPVELPANAVVTERKVTLF